MPQTRRKGSQRAICDPKMLFMVATLAQLEYRARQACNVLPSLFLPPGVDMPKNANIGCDARHSVLPPKAVNLRGIYNEKSTFMDRAPIQIVASFYEASLDETTWPVALDRLRTEVGADACALATHDFTSGSGRIVQAVGIEPESMAAYARRFSRFNVWLQQEEWFSRAAAVIEGSQLVERSEIAESIFYRDWLKAVKLFDHVFVILERRDSMVTFLMLGRAETQGPFSKPAITNLEGLAAELSRSYRTGNTARRLQAFRKSAVELLDTLPIGVVLLNLAGGVVSANRAARAVLDAGEPLYRANGGLAVEIGGRRLKIRDWVAQAVAADAEGGRSEPHALLVPRPTGQRPLTLLLTATAGGAASFDEETPVAVLYVGDIERGVQLDHTRVAKLYGLSRAESRVAALLASGYRLDQTAEILGVAYETVRKHLKQIFSKTGTFRQAELVRMLVTGPAGLSL